MKSTVLTRSVSSLPLSKNKSVQGSVTVKKKLEPTETTTSTTRCLEAVCKGFRGSLGPIGASSNGSYTYRSSFHYFEAKAHNPCRGGDKRTSRQKYVRRPNGAEGHPGSLSGVGTASYQSLDRGKPTYREGAEGGELLQLSI